MARKLFIAGNWKMNTSAAEGVALAGALTERLGAVDSVDLGVAPPLVYLSAVGKALADNPQAPTATKASANLLLGQIQLAIGRYHAAGAGRIIEPSNVIPGSRSRASNNGPSRST